MRKPSKPRVVGVDVARGLALIGMMATHTFALRGEYGSPSLVHVVASGRAVATFVLVAGVSVAFLTGGRTRPQGRDRAAVSAGLVVRAVLIGLIGLALGFLSPLNGILGILPFYGLLFLLVIPMLRLRSWALALVTVASFGVGSLVIVATTGVGLPYAGAQQDPTLVTLVEDPLGLLAQLAITGEYPVVVYLGYLAAGLALGRLDLSSRRVAGWLLGGGLVLAAAAQAVSWLVLGRLGGLAQLLPLAAAGDDPAQAANQLLWEPERIASWWYLALPAPHSHTPVDLVHTLGSAAAVLGAALLLTRIRAGRLLLSPIGAAGSLSLTLYCAHLLLLATGWSTGNRMVLFLTMAVGGLVFAAVWRRWCGQGPLERAVSVPAGAARRAVASALDRPRSGAEPRDAGSHLVWRVAARLLVVLVVAGVAGTGVWAVTHPLASAGEERDSASVTQPELAPDAGPEAGSAAETDAAGAGAAGPEGAEEPPRERGVPAEPGADAETDADPGGGVEPPAEGQPVPVAPVARPARASADVARYCGLATQLSVLTEEHPGQPDVVVKEGATILEEMRRHAPAEIRAAVDTVVDDLRARGGIGLSAAPAPEKVLAAEATIKEFVTRNC
ncbi:heparan-alpha-glucosaminide N-acetyltransferase domain-containing protein [Pseudonocardia halophobica]|uniref:heparan-alpha-glucosaminide N-acetyltransferase domain-containing protein n=1 Tax=Pseudonocardia halophobica TaxID=29401 RepID=UPI003D8A0C92